MILAEASLETLLEGASPALLVLLLVVREIAATFREKARRQAAPDAEPCPNMDDHGELLESLQKSCDWLQEMHKRTTGDGIPVWYFTEADRRHLVKAYSLAKRIREEQNEDKLARSRHMVRLEQHARDADARTQRVEEACSAVLEALK